MAGKARAQIIKEIEYHIANSGGKFTDWVVGVTDKPKHTLFSTHKLRPTGDPCISRQAVDDLQAQEVEDYFRSVRKTRPTSNGPSTLDHVFVYAYLKRPHTRP